MNPVLSRQIVSLLIAFAVAAVGLLVPASALADTALFRAEQRWHNFPNPPVTTPGNAGMYQGYVKPYILDTPAGKYNSPPSEAIVAPGNPVGGAFTLPQSFNTSMYTGVLSPKTAWPGYTTTYFYWAYNGPGKFEPGFGPTTPQRLVFPTTGGNPIPNYGLGNPVTPTTTFGGRYDLSRDGSVTVTPGPNRFGGTFRLFFYPEAHWEQYIYYFTPALYYGYGSYFCFDDGMYDCTPDTFVSEPGTTQIYNGTWWLLTANGKAKATTPIPGPRYSTKPTPTPYGNASYLRRSQHYFNLIHPWTTGFAAAHMAQGNESGTITPQGTGYDIKLSDATLSVKKYDWNQQWNSTLQTLTTTTSTPYTQIITGVTRVVSLVRPRLTWTIAVPLDPSVDPITNIWTPVRAWRLKVFFLPEPAGMLMLGIGIAALLGLARMRRR
jgi:hypothetical protein